MNIIFIIAAIIVGIGLLKFIGRVIHGLITAAVFAGVIYAGYVYGLPFAKAKGWI